MKFKAIIVISVVLSVAIVFQVVAWLVRPPVRSVSLDMLIPSELMGWRSATLPLDETEFLIANVAATLRFDNYVYREYSKDGRSFTLYAAYWPAGKYSAKDVASHTPDACWPRAGWSLASKGHGNHAVVQSAIMSQMEHRRFVKSDFDVDVTFGHLVGGRFFGYDGRAQPPVYAVFSDALSWGWRLGEEQFFFRIASQHASPPIYFDSVVSELIARISAEAKWSPQH